MPAWVSSQRETTCWPTRTSQPLVTERFYIDLPFNECVLRRKTRHRYQPADESFILIGEQQTAEIVAPQKLMPDVQVIDGTLDPRIVVQQILTPSRRPSMITASTGQKG